MVIYKFQPFAVNKKNFGREYNAHCAAVPNADDWILILDYDCMILSRMAYEVIERAIERYPDTDIFGAMCNRVGYSFQRLTEKPDENDSIKHHTRIADEMAVRYHDGQCKESHSVAGFFLLFRKSYWMNNPFQEHIIDARGNLFDYNFCRGAKRVRIIKGVYCWHSYRIMQENYFVKDHLKIEGMKYAGRKW
jgi:hypothetical protein